MQRLELRLQKCIRSCSRSPDLLDGSSITNEHKANHIFLVEQINEFEKKLKQKKGKSLLESTRSITELRKKLHAIYNLIKKTKLTSDQLNKIKTQLQIIYNELTGIPPTSELKNGDQLRNVNSYEYLRYIAPTIPGSLIDNPVFKKVSCLTNTTSPYCHSIAFGNLYTEYLYEVERLIESGEWKKSKERTQAYLKPKIEYLNKNILSLKNKINFLKKKLIEEKSTPQNSSIKNELDKLKLKLSQAKKSLHECNLKNNMHNEMIDRIYRNKNLAIERSHEMANRALQEVKQTSHKAETAVRHVLDGNPVKSKKSLWEKMINFFTSDNEEKIPDQINDVTPQQIGSWQEEGYAAVSPHFKPQFTSSLPSEKEYDYLLLGDHPEELRFGTQGQFYWWDNRPNPIFEEWLNVQEEKPRDNKPPYNHIYFNNLPRERSPLTYSFLDVITFKWVPKFRESKLTDALENMEKKHKNIAVITFPSDEGLMNKKMLDDRNKTIRRKTAFNEILAIANGSSKSVIQDFHISDEVKKHLYNKYPHLSLQENEDKILRKLLGKSFKVLGFKKGQKMSPADQQAVLFHFMKFELTNFIIKKLQPDSFNMACKDAIDRGGVSSAYYNLMKSIEKKAPLSQEEFERALHGAPTLVKGRAMNHHTQVIWNAIDAYISGHDKDPNSPITIPDWLRTWHIQHALKGTKAAHMRKLEKFANDSTHTITSFFNSSSTEEHQLAKQLLNALNSNAGTNANNPSNHNRTANNKQHPNCIQQPTLFQCTKKQEKMLASGKLKKIVDNLKHDNLLKIC